MARSWHIGSLTMFTSLASLVHSQLVTTTFDTITPTCTIESTIESAAMTGFVVPQYWCDCTNDGSTVTSTYSTMYGHTGAAACSWTIVDAGQASNTISPGPATIQTETASAGYPFYNELAWCAVANEDGVYPLMDDTESLSALSACSYTTRPASKITLTPVATTTCFATTSTADISTLIVSPSQACACVQGGVSAFYPYTTGSDACVFTTVPSSTVNFTTSTTSIWPPVLPSPTPTMVGQSCGVSDGSGCAAGDAGECKEQCVNNYAVSSQCGDWNYRKPC